MKNIIHILPLLALALMIGCRKEYVAPNSFSDAKIITSEEEGSNFVVGIDDYITFADVSQSASSHEWTISDGNAFISTDFGAQDSIFNEYIIAGSGLSTSDVTANVLFQRSGMQTVRLRNTFAEQVSLRMADMVLEAVQSGGEWVIDTTFTVDVYDKVKPAFKVLKNGTEVLSISEEQLTNIDDRTSWQTLDLESGETLEFIDLTAVGRPDGRRWNITGQEEFQKNDSIAEFTFVLGGSYTAQFTSIRSGNIAPASQVIKYVPLNIEVSADNVPFIYNGNLAENEDESISFSVTSAVAPFSGEEGNFTVQVTNVAAGFNESIPVQSASVDAVDPTKINLILSAPIYNTDVISVAFSGGNILSTDNRVLEDFAAATVAPFGGENFLNQDYYGFELGEEGWFLQQPDQWSIVDEMPATGTLSAKFFAPDVASGPNNMRLKSEVGTNPLVVSEGTYLLSMQVWVEDGTDIVQFNTNVSEPFMAITWNLESVARGEWVTLSQEVMLPTITEADASKSEFSIKKANISSSSALMFLDNVSLFELELR